MKTEPKYNNAIYLTPEERKVVRAAVRSSLELRINYAALQSEDMKMMRKQVRFITTEIPLLKSALANLK